MVTYEIKLNKMGEMTRLPDSQKLFGFLMNLLYEHYSENEISSLVKAIFSGQKSCMVSTLFPSGYYPTPKGYLIAGIEKNFKVNSDLIEKSKKEQNEIKETLELAIADIENCEGIKNSIKDELKKTGKKGKDELKKIEKRVKAQKKVIESAKKEYNEKAKEINHLSAKEIYETIKKMEFMKKEDMIKLLDKIENNKEQKITVETLESYDFIKKNQAFIQKFRLESQMKKLPGLPNVAYSLPIISFVNKKDEEVKAFSFFVSIDEKSILTETLEKIKTELLSQRRLTCFLGEKGSSGYNEYKMIDIVRVKKPLSKNDNAPKRYLNLGMLLPNKEAIDWEKSTLDIFSSDRKSFEIADEVPKVISFIVPGSVIEKRNGVAPYAIGKSIKNEYNSLHKDAIVFGNSFIEEWED